MRIANRSGRAVLVNATGDGSIDIATASAGRFGPDPTSVYEQWKAVRDWATDADLPAHEPVTRDQLDTPIPSPKQILAVGLNYRAHATESGYAEPEHPPVFTKFQSSLSGPESVVVLPPDGHTDWEVELVVVIGDRAHRVAEEDAWSHVAGLTVGQDLSERRVQTAGPVPQFSLGKSFPGFAPVGPWVVSVDEFADPDDLELSCSINGVEMQRGRTKEMIISVPRLVSVLSQIVTLHPGDLIFTGTPAGVGLGRDPQVWLRPGDKLVSWIEGIGEMRQRFVDEATGADGEGR
jgi:2,4-diketo-3-deoxy-L-fuconate hydrolase